MSRQEAIKAGRAVRAGLNPATLANLRQLGYLEMTPIQALVVERITRQVEKGLDSNLIAGITRSIITGGVQSWEAYQKLLAGILTASKPGDTKREENPS